MKNWTGHAGRNSDSEVHVEKVEQRPMGSIAFGLERIGLIAVAGADPLLHHSRRPLHRCAVRHHRIKIDDFRFSQLFRSEFPEYRQYEAETKRFPSANTTCWSSSSGKTLLDAMSSKSCATSSPTCSSSRDARRHLAVLRAPAAGAGGKLPSGALSRPPICRKGAAYDNSIERPVKANEIIRGKLLSETARWR